jgi:hypothetical protein
MLGRAVVFAAFKRLLAGGHEAQYLEPQLLPSDLGNDQVAMMDRVERAAEEADHPVLRPRLARVDRLR